MMKMRAVSTANALYCEHDDDEAMNFMVHLNYPIEYIHYNTDNML
jgi:hypothetical protein